MPHVALMLPGGLGEVDSGIHIPGIFGLVQRLSRSFSITAYSHSLSGQRPHTAQCGNAVVRFLGATAEDTALKRAATFLPALYHDHREKPFDLIHGIWGLPFGLYSVFAGKLLGIPSVVSLLGGETANVPEIAYGHMRKQPERALIQWICRQAVALTALSLYQMEQLKNYGVTRDDCEVIPPWVDCSLLHTSPKREPSPPYRFLHIGDINKVKDQATLLRAFSAVSSKVDAVLRIVGRDHLGGALQRLARDLHLEHKVEFPGFVSHREIPAHLSWADILLHSSLHEGGGTAIVEAMASGVVVCGTSVGVLADLRNTCCIAVPPGSHEQLGTEILELLNDRARYLALRTAALLWARWNDLDRAVQRHTALYHRLLRRVPAPSTNRVDRKTVVTNLS